MFITALSVSTLFGILHNSILKWLNNVVTLSPDVLWYEESLLSYFFLPVATFTLLMIGITSFTKFWFPKYKNNIYHNWCRNVFIFLFLGIIIGHLIYFIKEPQGNLPLYGIPTGLMYMAITLPFIKFLFEMDRNHSLKIRG
jgi:hypothetical protein